jgi:hypothetical protein
LIYWKYSLSRLGTLEAKVETEAHLRAAMDNDMATLDAKFGVQQKLIQAVAKTQSEHTALLRDHTSGSRRSTPCSRVSPPIPSTPADPDA